MYTPNEFVSVSGAQSDETPANRAPDFVDGPCLDLACPSASWPHPASSDLADPDPRRAGRVALTQGRVAPKQQRRNQRAAAMADVVVAGTGSRSLRTAPREIQVEAMNLVTERVAQRILEHGSGLVVMSGGAEGLDELLARVAIRLGVRLHLVLPSKTYAAHYWGRASLLGRDRLTEFEQIAAAAWKTTYVAEQILGTTKLVVDGLHINFHRNLIMAEWADDFVVWDPTSKGTAHCVKAIKATGKWRDDMVLGPNPLSDPGRDDSTELRIDFTGDIT